jgi:hypothetical protein
LWLEFLFTAEAQRAQRRRIEIEFLCVLCASAVKEMI